LTQFSIECRRHLRGSNHRYGLRPFGYHVQFDLVTWSGKSILGRDLGGDFQHPRNQLLESGSFGRQRKLVIRTPPHAGLSIPFRPDLKSAPPGHFASLFDIRLWNMTMITVASNGVFLPPSTAFAKVGGCRAKAALPN
jgi:hypothetical protein